MGKIRNFQRISKGLLWLCLCLELATQSTTCAAESLGLKLRGFVPGVISHRVIQSGGNYSLQNLGNDAIFVSSALYRFTKLHPNQIIALSTSHGDRVIRISAP